MAPAPDQSQVISPKAVLISLVLSREKIPVCLFLYIESLLKLAASLVMATSAIPKPLASSVASMEVVPEFHPERAPVSTSSPRRAVVLASGPKRASDSESSPERASVLQSSPEKAPVPGLRDRDSPMDFLFLGGKGFRP